MAKGKYFRWLAHDDLLAPGNLSRLAGTLETRDQTPLARAVRGIGRVTARRSRLLVLALVAAVAVAVPAIPRINVNDNPVRWFRADHEVRTSTELLNERLPGTFGANLVLRGEPDALFSAQTLDQLDELEVAWTATDVVGTVASVADVVSECRRDRTWTCRNFRSIFVLRTK